MSATHVARSEWRDFERLAPDANAALLELGSAAAAHGLHRGLLELVKLRASQVNGCAFCVAYHVAAAQRLAVAADKLHLLVAWRDTPLFDARERAALAWTEALTLPAQGVSDETYAEARIAFSETELAYLTAAVLAINAWNRLGIAYRFTPPRIVAEPQATAA